MLLIVRSLDKLDVILEVYARSGQKSAKVENVGEIFQDVRLPPGRHPCLLRQQCLGLSAQAVVNAEAEQADLLNENHRWSGHVIGEIAVIVDLACQMQAGEIDDGRNQEIVLHQVHWTEQNE